MQAQVDRRNKSLEGHSFLENFLSNLVYRGTVFWKTFCRFLENFLSFSGKLFVKHGFPENFL
jgi:hypothetical protein